MFGLEGGNSQKQPQTFVFELEKEFKDPEVRKKIHERVLSRLQLIKEQLRQGKDQETFNVLGHVLHGYVSLQKVLERSLEKK